MILYVSKILIEDVNYNFFMIVLGIESSCDETACAVVRNGKEILSNVIISQTEIHQNTGGVIPEIACRQHVDVIIPLIDQALKDANVTLSDIHLIGVAFGPGLIGALLIGLNAAKSLALALNIPFIGINHIEAHLYASLMSSEIPPVFPALGVVLSGGHTSLLLMHSIGNYELIGETIDDAIGEAFDKVAKMMHLPYPGGPEIEKLAREGNPNTYPLRGGVVKGKPFDFSFSGLKTAVLYTLRGQDAKKELTSLSKEEICNMAASFQQAAFDDVIKKVNLAAHRYECKPIIFGGGVTNNQTLRSLFQKKSSHLKQFWPQHGLSLDNAAMIAGLAYHKYLDNKSGDSFDLEATSRIKF